MIIQRILVYQASKNRKIQWYKFNNASNKYIEYCTCLNVFSVLFFFCFLSCLFRDWLTWFCVVTLRSNLCIFLTRWRLDSVVLCPFCLFSWLNKRNSFFCSFIYSFVCFCFFLFCLHYCVIFNVFKANAKCVPVFCLIVFFGNSKLCIMPDGQ